MTPEQSKTAAGNDVSMINVKFLSHFAQLCRESKVRYEGEYQIPFSEKWFSLPSNEYNPGLAYSGMGLCLSGYKNLPSNGYKYILGSLAAIGLEDIDITSFYHLNDENYIAALDDVNQISYAMGHKKIKDDSGKECELMVVLVRGTSVSIEWNSNSNVANSVADGDFEIVYHEGFKKSSDSAYVGMKAYIGKHGIDPATSKLWVIGHSRGATIANVIAALFNEDAALGFAKERIYSYNFSSSTTTRRPDANGPAFDNIFNIMNPEDYIPRLPPSMWDFKRFGRDMFLPSIATSYTDYRRYIGDVLKTFKMWTRIDYPAFHGNAKTNDFERTVYNISNNAQDMYCHERYSNSGTITFAQYFRVFTDIAAHRGIELGEDAIKLAKYGGSVFERFLGYFLYNEIAGHDAPGAHQEEGYLIKLMLCYNMGIDIEKNATCDTKRFTVYGPVELIVKNGNGDIVAHIDNGNVDEGLYSTDGFISMYYDKDIDASQVWIPNDGEYELLVSASTDGEYDFAWSRLAPLGDVEEQTVYVDVPLKKGEFVKWDDLEAGLEGKKVGEFNNLSAETTVSGEGVAGEGETMNGWAPYGDSQLGFPTLHVLADTLSARHATYGDHVVVEAYCDKHIAFNGWYEDGKFVCGDEKYVFRIEGNRQLEARFDRK